MNQITIHGRLAKDPEIKYINGKKGETSVCNFTVAVNRKMGEEADFFNCKTFGKRAEVIEKFMSKGSEIILSGEMQCRKYQDKNGENRYAWEVLMDSFDFCGSKKDNPKPSKSTPAGFEEIDDEDGIPF